MEIKQCQHYKWVKPSGEEARMVDFFNPIEGNTDCEKCVICGARRYNPIPEFDKPAIDSEGTDEEEFKNEIEANIEAHYLLKRLPKRQREIAQLLVDGYNQTEIAEKLGVHRNTIVREMVHLREKTFII